MQRQGHKSVREELTGVAPSSSPRQVEPSAATCTETADHKHVIDFHSVTQADVDPSELIMDVSCKACGKSGAFRIPEVSEIDW